MLKLQLHMRALFSRAFIPPAMTEQKLIQASYCRDRLTSMKVWKMAGVVREEKVIVLELYSCSGKWLRNWLMMAVFPVPGPPTSSEACSQ